jgi:probable phosphoglycerate mutase
MSRASAAPAVPLRAPLIFVRHGETDWNVVGRLQGQREIPLNARGRDQAAAVGRSLARRLGPAGLAAHRFVASPMARARETMAILRAAMGLPVADYALDERLRELTFGSWEGLTWREVQQRSAQEAARREADKWGFTPPGGESYAALCERIAPWLAGLDAPTLAVSHGGVARAAMHLALGLDPREASMAEITQGRAMLFADGGMQWL